VQTIITHAGGSTTTSFDEPANTNQWKSFGQFSFNAGTNTGTLELNNNNGNAAGANMNVDAARWVFRAYPVQPPAPGADQTICAGGSATLTAVVGPSQTVDWYTGGCGTTLVQTGATSINVSPAVTTTYYARARYIPTGAVSGSCSSVTVIVKNTPVVSAPTPTDPTVCAGSSINLSVNVTGTGPFSYQWKRGSTDVGTSSQTLTLTNVSVADAGLYTCVVTAAPCPPVTSASSTVTVVATCDDSNPCTADNCDLQTGQCLHPVIDSDNDGTPDCSDGCPNDPDKTAPGVCGCGVSEGACRSIVQWRSVRTHTGAGDLAIVLDAAATGNSLAGPTVEPRQGGIERIEVQLNGAIALGDTNAITVTGYQTSSGVLGPATPFTPSSVVLSGADTLVLTFQPALPDESCYLVEIGAAAITESLQGDTDVYVRALAGDATGSGVITLSDALLVNASAGAAVNAAPAKDLDLSGAIDAADALFAKNRVSSPARQALCP
jgi:hypothetical protein